MAFKNSRPGLVALGLSMVIVSLACKLGVPSESRPAGELDGEDAERVARDLAQGFQGAYLVARHDTVIAASGVGLACRQSGDANTLETSFRLASLTKPMTAVAVLQLVERGLIKLDEKVSTYLPGYGPSGDLVTIKHLLTHSSGIPDYGDLGGAPRSSYELVDTFRRWPLAFRPGEQFAYSNSNFALLGYLIEQASGVSYAEYMEENIFSPAGMLHSGFHFPAIPGKGFAAPSGGDINGPWEPNSKAYAAGALYASASDMLAFNRALSHGILLKPETFALMREPQIGGYGLGVYTNGSKIGHDGIIAGFTAQWYSFPDEQDLVVVLSNGPISATVLADRLLTLLGR